MKLHKRGEIILFALLVVTSVLVVSCMVSDENVHYTGIDDEMLKQIKPGETTRDWLVSELGEPTEQSMTEDGIEILRYKCTKTTEKEFVLIPPVIVTSDQKTAEHVIAFEVKDGIVQRYRKES